MFLTFDSPPVSQQNASVKEATSYFWFDEQPSADERHATSTYYITAPSGMQAMAIIVPREVPHFPQHSLAPIYNTGSKIEVLIGGHRYPDHEEYRLRRWWNTPCPKRHRGITVAGRGHCREGLHPTRRRCGGSVSCRTREQNSRTTIG